MTNTEQSLSDGAAGEHQAPQAGAATPFGNPTGTVLEPPAPDAVVRQWTVAEVLELARLPRRRATICLRANLQEKYDTALTQLAGLVDAQGQVIENDERSADQVSNASRAVELSQTLTSVRDEMAAFMWYPLFEGLSADDMVEFNKKHRPKDVKADHTEYYALLVAECSVEPKMSIDQVRSLRKKIGTEGMNNLAETAQKVCSRGGVDFPQLPAGLARLKQQ